MVMAVHRNPQRRDAIEVTLAMDINEIIAFGTLDNNLLTLEPISHLRKGVPNIGFIP